MPEMLRKLALLALFFLPVLLFSSALGLSSQEALNFVSGSFLNPDESAEIYPVRLVSTAGTEYWIVTILSGNSPTGFIAVKNDESKEILTAKSINTQLFKTAFFLRNYSKLKEANPQNWFFTQSNAGFFDSLAGFISSEVENDLTIIEIEVVDDNVSKLISEMKKELVQLKQDSEKASESISSAASFESSFLSTPKTEELNDLQEKLNAVITPINSLNSQTFSYDSKVTQLKSLISKKESLDLSEKTYLVGLAEQPLELRPESRRIALKKDLALSTLQQVSGVFDASAASALNFADNLQVRVNGVNARMELYGVDETLKQKTSNSYSTLKQAVEDILSIEKKELWKKQAEVQNLEENWRKAEGFYNKGEFENAVEFALKAKQNAITIFKNGFAEQPEPENGFLSEEIMNLLLIGIAVVVIIAVIITVFKVLKKFGGKKESNDAEESYSLKT